MKRIAISAVLLVLACARVARAESHEGDPFAYDLRVAIQPLAFQAGISQSWFGSAARLEYSPAHFMDVAVDGRVAWLNANRRDALAHSYAARAVLSFHLAQSVDEQPLYGTVYPADTPVISPGPVGTSQDLIGVPSSEKMRTAFTQPGDRNLSLVAAMRDAHSLRVGASYAKVLELTRPDVDAVARNSLLMLHLGYSFATYWNLPTSVTGKRELGYRRFYGDVLLTTGKLTDNEPERTREGGRLDFQALGLRLGLQGATEGLLENAPSLGMSYDLELGVYPGRGGIEGYLFLALGVALDAATR